MKLAEERRSKQNPHLILSPSVQWQTNLAIPQFTFCQVLTAGTVGDVWPHQL